MKNLKRTSRVVVAAFSIGLISIFFAGCSHPLTIKNLQTYENRSMMSLEQPLSIGIIPQAGDIHCERLVKGVGEALGKYSANVMLPYSKGSLKCVDVLTNINVRPKYEGSGWNFLINWPGFLIFTPAWNGYVYSVDYNVDIALTRASDNSNIDTFNIPINLNIRHAAIDRTWTEISWFEVSAIALIGGIVFIQYDDDVSPLVMDKIYGPVGDYIAQEIVSRINNAGGFVQIGKIKENKSFSDEPDQKEDAAAQLIKLKELKDNDILTDEEYETRRKSLLDKL